MLKNLPAVTGLHALRQEWGAFLFFAAALSLAYVLYSFAFTAGFFFDDEPNLAPLGRIQSFHDLVDFLFSGSAGPLGRPISLASFLIHLGAWPHDPAAFFYANTLIHLINACLLYWFCHLLLTQTRIEVPAKAWVCAWGGALWALHPLLLSASMFAVQRMTLLSATFVLLGLIAYLKIRGLPATHRMRIPSMLASLAVFGLLAGMCKENGLLLPFYVLVLEYALLKQSPAPRGNPAQRLYPAILWLLPAIAITYLALHWGEIRAGYGGRPFTLEQRLMSESIILWDYVRLTFFPARSGLNPFKGEEFLVAQMNGAVILAIAAWVGIAMLALLTRKRWPWLAFGVFWFLVGHSMESSVIPLELYFHHRNYLPAAGALLAAVLGISQIGGTYRSWGYRTCGLILAGFAFVLYQAASVWGNVPLAAALWYEEQPDSERAVQFHARTLSAQGEWGGAYELISKAARNQPTNSAFKLQQLQTACGLDMSPVELEKSYRLAANGLEQTLRSFAATDALDKLRQMVENGECGLDMNRILELHGLLQRNPSFQQDGNLRFELHMIRARIYKHLRELDPMMQELEAAHAIRPTLNLATLMAYELATAELFDDAMQKLEEIEQHLPRNPWLRNYWQNELARARDGLQAMRSDQEDLQ